MMTTDKLILSTGEQVARFAARCAVKGLQMAIESYGSATWVLAGGTSPARAYRMIADELVDGLDWKRVWVVIGDERYVPSGSAQSNWKQVDELLLRFVDVPTSQQLKPDTSLTPEGSAINYEARIRSLLPHLNDLPRLDHAWLGVGEDGHTLSLFPDHHSREPTNRLVRAVHESSKSPPDRITLTLNALRGIRNCLILALGARKATIVQRALEGDLSLPIVQAANIIAAAGGNVTWLLDSAAADGYGLSSTA
jgi:6-phosphogluconolactonase